MRRGWRSSNSKTCLQWRNACPAHGPGPLGQGFVAVIGDTARDELGSSQIRQPAQAIEIAMLHRGLYFHLHTHHLTGVVFEHHIHLQLVPGAVAQHL
jgi:hypothetical protein